MKEIIYKYTLQNALKYSGKANAGAVMGKVLGEKPELKNDMKALGKEIAETIKKVSSIKPEKQLEELKKIAPELLEEKKEEKKELKELPNAIIGKVTTRIPPEPSKYTHIGHALSFLINYVYAQKYNGKCILRYEDTNPEKVKQEYVDAMEYDIKEYLGIKPDATRFVSDDMEILYSHATKIVDKGTAYVCFCTREDMQNLRHKGQECICRNKSIEKNQTEWVKLLEGKYKEGECTLRLKANMKADNQVMRDPVIFRIDKTNHYRHGKKYSAWPIYDFYSAIEEELCGITYVLRSNEFGTMRSELQSFIRKQFNYKDPLEYQYGRFNVNDKISQGREIRELIEQGKVKGWDDPRLTTLKALKRRGIIRETYYELVKEVGLTKTQTNIDFEVISSINRKLLDKKCNRYFLVVEPVTVKIENAPERTVSLPLHQEEKERGDRTMYTNNSFHIQKSDYDRLETGKINRFMECLNFTKKGEKLTFDSQEYEHYRDSKKKGIIMHYLPVSKELIKVEILMEDGTITKGIAEPDLINVKEDQIIQFERNFFARLETIKNNVYKFVFCHK